MADKLVASFGEQSEVDKSYQVGVQSSQDNVNVNLQQANTTSDRHSVLFWKFISNLPRSISQRRKSITSDSLEPEVAGYLARMQQQQQQLPSNQQQFSTNKNDSNKQESKCNNTIVVIQNQQANCAAATLGPLARTSHQSVQVREQVGQRNIQKQTTNEENLLVKEPIKNNVKQTTMSSTKIALTTPKKVSEITSQKQGKQHKKLAQSSTSNSASLSKSSSISNSTSSASTSTSSSSSSSSSSTSSSNSMATKTMQKLQRQTSNDDDVGSMLSSCVISEQGSDSSSVSNEVRLRWSKKMDFLLSIIGFAVDLANIWRFPYLVYKNGGGVFLIPYVIMLIFGGIPLFFLELCLGQFVKKGPITVWNKICPAMKGVGYCSILISWYVSFYYNVLIGWSVYFIYRSFVSFGHKMPWEDCDNHWNSGLASAFYNFTKLTQQYNESYLNWYHSSSNNITMPITTATTTILPHDMLTNQQFFTTTFPNEHQQQQLATATATSLAILANTTCVSISQLKAICSHRDDPLEMCKRAIFHNVSITSPATEFFVKELSQIDQSTGLDDMGYLRIELVLCTLLVYLLHYFSLFRGLETSGKVVWVTATAPYLILSVLLVRGLFLPGATRGIQYYLSPRLEKLADPQVWTDAAVQVFYSIGVGFGVHLTYASFNQHNNNCHRDCLMTSAVNVITSVYSGLVVFVYIGYMAQNMGVEIDEVASEGYSLVFEVYPEALTTLPFARFWSILFFIMLLTLGIDSAMGGLEAVITGIEDEFKFAKNMHRGLLTGLVIASSFVFALISCTQGGAYTLFWFDIYSASVSLLFSALFEALGVVYFYGLDKFILDIESMLGRRPHMFYIICWKYISPLFLGGVIFTSLYTAVVPTYRGYTFPIWSVILGWCLTFSSVIAVPIFAIVHYIKVKNGSRRRTRSGGAASSAASSRHNTGGGANSGKKTPGSQHHHNHHHHHHHNYNQQKDQIKHNELEHLKQDKNSSWVQAKSDPAHQTGMITAV